MRTPLGDMKVFTVLHEEFDFTMDAAASHANALLDTYCTDEGKFHRDESGAIRLVEKHYAGGLFHEFWRDERVFCNPPYVQSELPLWLEAVSESVRMGISSFTCLLLPPSVDPRWFIDLFG